MKSKICKKCLRHENTIYTLEKKNANLEWIIKGFLQRLQKLEHILENKLVENRKWRWGKNL